MSIVAIVTALGMVVSRFRPKPARVDELGWRQLRPSVLLHVTFAGCVAMASLPAWSLAKGGSAHPDAAHQNVWAVCIMLGFAAAAFYVGWLNYGRSVRWKDGEIRVRRLFGHEAVYLVSAIDTIGYRGAGGAFRIIFTNGSKLDFPAYAHGAEELLHAATSALNMTGGPAAGAAGHDARNER